MLDQGQTLTYDGVNRTYNLVTFDQMKTERGHRKSDGTYSALRLDHNIDEKKASNRNLLQINEQVICPDSTRGSVTVNVTVSTIGNVPISVQENLLDMVLAFVPTVQSRWLNNES